MSLLLQIQTLPQCRRDRIPRRRRFMAQPCCDAEEPHWNLAPSPWGTATSKAACSKGPGASQCYTKFKAISLCCDSPLLWDWFRAAKVQGLQFCCRKNCSDYDSVAWVNGSTDCSPGSLRARFRALLDLESQSIAQAKLIPRRATSVCWLSAKAWEPLRRRMTTKESIQLSSAQVSEQRALWLPAMHRVLHSKSQPWRAAF